MHDDTPRDTHFHVRRRLLGGLAGAGALAATGCGQSGTAESSAPGDPVTQPPPAPGPGPQPPAVGQPPRGLHASFTSNNVATERTITWFTDGEEAGEPLIEFDVVRPGMTAEQIANEPLSMRFTGTSDPTPGVPAITHRATASSLDPTLAMRYRVGSDAGGFSPVRVIAPTPADTWRFIHWGDHGTTPNAIQVADHAATQNADLLLLAGDLSYANGNQPVWDAWFDLFEPLFSTTVTMAAPGNHENEDDPPDADNPDGGRTYKNRFSHPNPPTAAVTGGNPGSTFYAFDYNRVHFLVTTAGALINDGTLPEEIAAIEADLAVAAARRAAGQIDFIIVMQHFTIWTDQEGRGPANPTLVALEENIIVRYGVDLLIVGHDHVYQRSVPMAFGQPNPLGYVQVMAGTGGKSVRLFDDEIQGWSAKTFVGIGYATYDVQPGRIDVRYFGAPPQGTSDELRQIVTEPFSLVDEFSVTARSPEVARACVLPPRAPEVLLANYDAVARHTRERNRNAHGHHHG